MGKSLFYQTELEPKNRGDREAGTSFNVFAAKPPSLRQKRLMYSFNRMHLIANLVLLLLLPLAAIGNKFDATIVKTETDGGNCLLNVFAICLLAVFIDPLILILIRFIVPSNAKYDATIINTKSDWKTKSGAGNCLLNVAARHHHRQPNHAGTS